ncbi:hypothetical protein PDE_01857 [Penicillium oxalicum 114-2]|uniref:Uncharacterized protein n=1 Tax=Penicillium oxalicum (strain 114-2 / CGMCC 5302) TaxID=933388 RepID=S8AY80_PENO1|nr:hypothetical protein PDE_01857 [Penicillium oxalicum 114-2]
MSPKLVSSEVARSQTADRSDDGKVGTRRIRCRAQTRSVVWISVAARRSRPEAKGVDGEVCEQPSSFALRDVYLDAWGDPWTDAECTSCSEQRRGSSIIGTEGGQRQSIGQWRASPPRAKFNSSLGQRQARQVSAQPRFLWTAPLPCCAVAGSHRSLLGLSCRSTGTILNFDGRVSVEHGNGLESG